jgi:hypothetical protein
LSFEIYPQKTLQLKTKNKSLVLNSSYTSVRLSRLFKNSFLNIKYTNLIYQLKKKRSNFLIKFFYQNSKIKNFIMRKNSSLRFGKKLSFNPSLLQLLFNSRLRYIFKIIHSLGPSSLGFQNRKFNHPFFLKRFKKYSFKRKKSSLLMLKLIKINQSTIVYNRSYNYMKNINLKYKPLLSTNHL